MGDIALAVSSGAAILIVLVILAVILGDVVIHGASRLSPRFFFTAPEQGMTEGGIFPALFGTVAMVLLMTLAVVPVGVATAVYLHEYASPRSWLTRTVRIAVSNLAGVPSIVFGLFGLGFFVQFVGAGMDRVFHGGQRVWGQPAPDRVQGSPSPGRSGNLDGYDSRHQPRGGGGRPHPLHGGRLLPADVAEEPARPVHAPREPHLCVVHAVPRRGRDQTFAVRNCAGTVDLDVCLEPGCGGREVTNAPAPDGGRMSAAAVPSPVKMKLAVRDLEVFYGPKRGLAPVTIDLPEKNVTALIGPSGCGKSTFLRSLNRMNELIASCRVRGDVRLDGEPIYGPGIDPVVVRRRIGMVFQRSNPFPKSIFENVAYGLRIGGINDRSEIAGRVERALGQAALWEEVKERLQDNALGLSGGQQQRLCIARALAVEPEVLLMDEPASALDPIATTHIEELIDELSKDYTVVIVTHNMQQAARVSDWTAFFYMGELVEFDRTNNIFTKPSKSKTEDYITGRFG